MDCYLTRHPDPNQNQQRFWRLRQPMNTKPLETIILANQEADRLSAEIKSMEDKRSELRKVASEETRGFRSKNYPLPDDFVFRFQGVDYLIGTRYGDLQFTPVQILEAEAR